MMWFCDLAISLPRKESDKYYKINMHENCSLQLVATVRVMLVKFLYIYTHLWLMEEVSALLKKCTF